MKKKDKDIVKIIVLMVMAMIFLLCGSLAWDLGEEGKGIVLIMCSLYTAMWVHAGMIATIINTKLENEKKETGYSGIVGNAP